MDIARRSWDKRRDDSASSKLGALDLTIVEILRSITGNIITVPLLAVYGPTRFSTLARDILSKNTKKVC